MPDAVNPELLRRYEAELRYIREMGGDFAREYPKIAGRLGLDALECADPYVERLLEGFAFLAARVQLKLDARFPDFTRHLLELVYPHLTTPLPSMAVVALEPDLASGALETGYTLPAGTALKGLLAKGERTACEFRTAHAVTLWPLRVSAARYLPSPGMIASRGLPLPHGAKAALQIELELTGGGDLKDLALDRLPLYLRGGDEIPMWIYEAIHGTNVGIALRGAEAEPAQLLRGAGVRQPGFEREEALLPLTRRAFDGYRLVQEYFAFPQRYLFAELTGLRAGCAALRGQRLEITIFLKRAEPRLEHTLETSNFVLFAAPVINLFPRTADRIHVTPYLTEFHVVPDRSRPMDFEVFRVDAVTGFGRTQSENRSFQPFYRVSRDGVGADGTYFTTNRRPRMASSRQRREGGRTGYLGSEVFLSLVDGHHTLVSEDLRQLEIRTLCTNRDLPIQMAVGRGSTDFTLETAAPVNAVRVIAGPTRPRAPVQTGETPWRLLSHLSLNYLSLADSGPDEGAAALRQLLELYVEAQHPLARHVAGVLSVHSTPAVRRMPSRGPICFGNGVELRVRLDEDAFTGVGAFLLGAVLERFFAKYVSINSFTQTVVESTQRGEIMQWPVRTGLREPL